MKYSLTSLSKGNTKKCPWKIFCSSWRPRNLARGQQSYKHKALKQSDYRSQYCKRQNANRRPTDKLNDKPNETCYYCGKLGRGHKAPPKLRKQEFPGFGTICLELCGQSNHYEISCQSKDKPSNRDLPLKSARAGKQKVPSLALYAAAPTGTIPSTALPWTTTSTRT